LGAYYGGLGHPDRTDTSNATTGSSSQTTLASNIDSVRQGVDGINIDEETQNLVQYQNAYQAAARTLNVIETLLTTQSVSSDTRVGERSSTMRIATSTIYAQQTAAIDEQTALYAEQGAQLSSGKQLNAPSDDPSQIAEDLQLHVTIDTSTQQSTNVQNAVSELTRPIAR